jgi:hypothetical protein
MIVGRVICRENVTGRFFEGIRKKRFPFTYHLTEGPTAKKPFSASTNSKQLLSPLSFDLGKTMLSARTLLRLERQGYGDMNLSEMERIENVLRLLPGACAVLIGAATAAGSSTFMYLLMMVAFMSAALPNHPLEILYNSVSRLSRPQQIPPNRIPRRAGCAVVAVFLYAAGHSFVLNCMASGYTIGSALVVIAAIKAVTGYCPVAHLMYLANPAIVTRRNFIEKFS